MHNADNGPIPVDQAQFFNIMDIEIAPDGALYVCDWFNDRICKISTDRIMTTIAGTGPYGGYSGDNIPASSAQLNGPRDIDLGPDGTIYIADRSNHRIRMVDKNGIIHTIAGNGIRGHDGDGEAAVNAKIDYPTSIAVDNDGNVFFTERLYVRKINPSGTIQTIAGNGQPGNSGDGGPAYSASIEPLSITCAKDGSLYITSQEPYWYYPGGYCEYTCSAQPVLVRKISPDGIITTITSNSNTGLDRKDGVPSSQEMLYRISSLHRMPITLDAEGTLYIASDFMSHISKKRYWYTIDGYFYSPSIRTINSQGIITTLLGSNDKDRIFDRFYEDKYPFEEYSLPQQVVLAEFDMLRAVTLGPDKSIYAAKTTYWEESILKIEPHIPGYGYESIFVPSEDNSEIYHFDINGRHLSTLNAQTFSLIDTFLYDESGNLTQIVDTYGNATTIERDASGAPLSIIAPHGQRTTLGVDHDGYLSSVSDPAGNTTTMTYHDGGLLATFTDANDNESRFYYDTLGLLVRDENAAGGSVSLERVDLEKGFEVRDSSAEGRVRVYTTEFLDDGSWQSTVSGCCGGTTVSRTYPDGVRETAYADSTKVRIQYGPDPRFGMQAPVTKNRVITTPGGLKYESVSSRSIELSDSSNVFSLKRQVEKDTINGRVYTTVYDDSLGKITSTSPTGRTTVSYIDSLGRITGIEIPGLAPVEFEYDNLGRLTAITEDPDGDSRMRSFSYNLDGYVETSSNPLSQATGFTYDDAGRIIAQTLPDGRLIGFGYDPVGNVTGIIPPGKPDHTFTYTPVNLQETYNPPVVDAGPTTTSYIYDLDKKLTRIDRP
ncbi:MAG: hypothetical protein GF350_01515, partial [Chitinivibrionales bacterium]|nr:hypothetical protein [Chitinivibrionales bacterium]